MSVSLLAFAMLVLVASMVLYTRTTRLVLTQILDVSQTAAGRALRILDRPFPSPPPVPISPAFVFVMAEGERLEDSGEMTARIRRVTLGQCAMVEPGRDVILELTAQLSMRNVRVIVFCDLMRVRVGGVYIGTEYCQGAVGECPTAYAERWDVGQKLRVPCWLRERDT